VGKDERGSIRVWKWDGGLATWILILSSGRLVPSDATAGSNGRRSVAPAPAWWRSA